MQIEVHKTVAARPPAVFKTVTDIRNWPRIIFAALARACGGHGFAARSPGELKAAVSEAVDIDGPAIVDAIVVSNETPNLPHLDLDMIGHFAVAKIKEAVLAVTGG
jgi:pyruvate dehydrogenase (quinone)